MQTRYERRRNQRSHIWRKRRAIRSRETALRNYARNLNGTAGGASPSGSPMKSMKDSFVAQWVAQALMAANRTARENDCDAALQSAPRKVMQRRGA